MREALRRRNGNGAVRLLDCDLIRHALLLERCEPGFELSTVDPDTAVEVLLAILPRLWVHAGEPFTTLYDEAKVWADHMPISWERAGRPFETALLDSAVAALELLQRSERPQVLIHQDLRPGNVLRATREPWLVIDPKPLIGEPEFSISPIIRARELLPTM